MAETKVFVDMDGVLARFYKDPDCLKHYHDHDFFINLEPYENMVAALSILEKEKSISLFILSTAESEEIEREKREWLTSKGLDQVEQFFPRTSQKAEYIIQTFGELGDQFYLIDDYSRNLKEWQSFGGSSIKALNELNGRGFNGHHFRGPCVDITASVEEIASQIRTILDNE